MALLYRMGTGNGSGGDLKPYIVQFTCDSGYIGQTLTMIYKGTPHAGETVDNVSGTVASDGTLTLYPMHSGNWECSCYSSVVGITMKKTIELSYWGTTNVEFNDTPDGATATPTDDVQTWLHCANIWDKTNLTTIDDVIADTTTLNTLISDNNATDYLVRSTTWASDICNNESAMTYIGLNDYCANKLLDDSTWLDAICNAKDSSGKDLFEYVLNVKVPEMASNTTPVGYKVTPSSTYSSQYDGYMAFDSLDNGGWLPSGTDTFGNANLTIELPNGVVVKKIELWGSVTTEIQNYGYFSVYGIDSDGVPHLLTDLNNVSLCLYSQQRYPYKTSNNIPYKKFKVVYISNTTNDITSAGGINMQLYGREEA